MKTPIELERYDLDDPADRAVLADALEEHGWPSIDLVWGAARPGAGAERALLAVWSALPEARQHALACDYAQRVLPMIVSNQAVRIGESLIEAKRQWVAAPSQWAQVNEALIALLAEMPDRDSLEPDHGPHAAFAALTALEGREGRATLERISADAIAAAACQARLLLPRQAERPAARRARLAAAGTRAEQAERLAQLRCALQAVIDTPA